MHTTQLPSGSWRVVVQVGGHRASGTAPTKRAAQKLGAQLVLDLEQQVGTTRRRRTSATVADLVARHLSHGNYSPTTLAELERARDRIPADLGRLRVDEVDGADLDRVYRQLSRTVAPGGVRRVHELLSAAFTTALRWGWVRANPAQAARPPATPRRRVTVPTPDTVARILAAVDDDAEFAAFVRLAVTTGARRGELAGLLWGDLHLDAGVVVISRSVAWTKASGLVVKSTKTGGIRSVALDPGTVDAVKRWRRELGGRHLACVAPDAFAFGAVDRPPRPDRFTQRWVRLMDRLGLEVRLHDLRHWAASRLIGGGVDPVTVAGRLGHASPTTTLRVYAAFLPERDRAAAELLAGELSVNRATPSV